MSDSGVLYGGMILLILAGALTVFLTLLFACVFTLSARISRLEEQQEREWHSMTTSDAMYKRTSAQDDFGKVPL